MTNITLSRELVEQSINILQKTYLSSYSSEMKRRDIVIELQNALSGSDSAEEAPLNRKLTYFEDKAKVEEAPQQESNWKVEYRKVPDGYIDDILTCASQLGDALRKNDTDRIKGNSTWMNQLVLDGAEAASKSVFVQQPATHEEAAQTALASAFDKAVAEFGAERLAKALAQINPQEQKAEEAPMDRKLTYFEDKAKVEEEPQQETSCNCRWVGENQTQQCELHAAHVEAIHDWASRAKAAEEKLKQQPASNGVTNTHGEPVAWARYPRYTGSTQKPDVVFTKPEGKDWVEFYTSPQPTPMELRSGELVQAARQALEALEFADEKTKELHVEFEGEESHYPVFGDAITELLNALMSVPDGKGTT